MWPLAARGSNQNKLVDPTRLHLLFPPTLAVRSNITCKEEKDAIQLVLAFVLGHGSTFFFSVLDLLSFSFAFFSASGGRSSCCKGGCSCGHWAVVVRPAGFVVDGDEEIGGGEAGGRWERRAKGDGAGLCPAWGWARAVEATVELAAGLRDKEQPLGKRLREVEGPVCQLWAEATAAGGLAAGAGSAERGKNGGWPREQEEEGRCWEQGSERPREGKVPAAPLGSPVLFFAKGGVAGCV